MIYRGTTEFQIKENGYWYRETIWTREGRVLYYSIERVR